MNKARRKSLQSLADRLEEIKSALEDLQAEEEEYRDNMPENMWGGERYEKAEDAISNMEDAVSSLEDVLSSIESAME